MSEQFRNIPSLDRKTIYRSLGTEFATRHKVLIAASQTKVMTRREILEALRRNVDFDKSVGAGSSAVLIQQKSGG